MVYDCSVAEAEGLSCYSVYQVSLSIFEDLVLLFTSKIVCVKNWCMCVYFFCVRVCVMRDCKTVTCQQALFSACVKQSHGV